MYIAGLIILTFFAIVGAARFIGMILRSAGGYDTAVTLVLHELKADDAELRIRSAAALCEEIRCSSLCCECADSEARRICEMLRADLPIIEIAGGTHHDPPADHSLIL